MADLVDKENLSPIKSASKIASIIPSPTKKKSRSKSIGPGGLDGVLEAQTVASPDKNRRKVGKAQCDRVGMPDLLTAC